MSDLFGLGRLAKPHLGHIEEHWRKQKSKLALVCTFEKEPNYIFIVQYWEVEIYLVTNELEKNHRANFWSNQKETAQEKCKNSCILTS